MNGRNATIVVLMLTFIAACFLSGAAISGEHPWDADVLVGEFNWDRYDIANTDNRGDQPSDTAKSDSSDIDTASSPDQSSMPGGAGLVKVAFDWLQLLLIY